MVATVPQSQTRDVDGTSSYRSFKVEAPVIRYRLTSSREVLLNMGGGGGLEMKVHW